MHDNRMARSSLLSEPSFVIYFRPSPAIPIILSDEAPRQAFEDRQGLPAARRFERPVGPDRLMNLQNDPNSWSLAKFGIGQPVLRSEDPVLVRGQGRFTDDVSVPGQAYAVIIRSRHAHGIIRGIKTEAACGMPGVLGVYTGADLLAAGYGTLKCIVPFKTRDGSELK